MNDSKNQNKPKYISELKSGWRRSNTFRAAFALSTLWLSVAAIAVSVIALKEKSAILETLADSRESLISITFAAIGTVIAAASVSSLPKLRSFIHDLSKALNRIFELFLGIEKLSIEDLNRRAFRIDKRDAFRIDKIEKNIETLHGLLSDEMRYFSSDKITEQKFDKLVSSLVRERVISNVKESIGSIYSKYESDRLRSSILDDVFISVIEKIERERQTLSLRTGLNVLAGIVIAGLGLILLWNFMSHIDTLNVDTTKAVVVLSIRFSIVLFIAVFSLFFLNLFRSGLSDMKYYVNEYTNISAMFASAKLAIHLNDKKLIEIICKKLLETERNFILRKGERTIGTAYTEGEMEYFDKLVSKISLLSGSFGSQPSSKTVRSSKATNKQ